MASAKILFGSCFGLSSRSLARSGALRICLAVAMIALSLGATSSGAENPEPPELPQLEWTKDEVSQRLKQVDANAALEAAAKATLTEIYKQILEELRIADERTTKGAEFDHAREAAPAALEKLKCEAPNAPPEPPELPRQAKLTELEQLLATAESELAAAHEGFNAAENEPKHRSLRRVELSKLIAAADQKIDDLQKQVFTPNADESAELNAARRGLWAARKKSAQADLDAFKKELASYDTVSGDLLKLERDKTARAVSVAEKRFAALRELANAHRRAETEQQANEARWAAATAVPAVRRLAEDNTALAEHRKLLAQKIEPTVREAEQAVRRLGQIRENSKRVAEKAKAAGFTNAIGQLMRKQRADLPDIWQYRHSIHVRHAEISHVQLELFDLEDRRSGLADIDSVVESTLAALGPKPAVDRDDLHGLLQTKRDYLDSLIADYETYFKKLVDLDATEQELIVETKEYTRYIDRRVLWIRSTSPFALADLGRAWQSALGLIESSQWTQTLHLLFDDACAYWGAYLLACGVFLGVQFGRPRLRRLIDQWGQQASSSYSTCFAPTFHTAVATILLGCAWPGVLYFLGWRLSLSKYEFPLALGDAMQFCAIPYAVLAGFIQICRPGGLAAAHFSWPAGVLVRLRKHLRTLVAFGLPIMLVVATVQHQSSDDWKDSLGRVGLSVGLLFVAGFLHQMLRPRQGVVYQALPFHSGGWIVGLSHFWHLCFVGAPLAMAGLALAGYHFTSVRLTCWLQATLCFVVVLTSVYALLLRWLLLARRRLALQPDRRSDAGAVAAIADSAEAPKTVLETPGLNLGQIDVQTRRLLRSFLILGGLIGLGVIWADALPALGILDQLTLWAEADGTKPVTLANLALSLVVLVMTIIACRNLPGLMEVAILQRLPFEASVRYAITTVSRYLFLALGVMGAFWLIGVGWSKVQWLVAAITVGLGFGLQEIFADFFSGLIILFERPMRVGDTVTVGELTGVVSRIRMRATTITDYDRKELIVPNKEFITGRLVNWTLSDRTIRLVVRVCIANGSNTQLAQNLLHNVAAEHRHVLREPHPTALFLGFGDNGLIFELRVFVSIDHYGTVQHDLNTAIEAAFIREGLELAMPQCEMHLHNFDGRAIVESLAAPRPYVAA